MKTSITVFPSPISSAVLSGSIATATINTVIVKHGVRQALSSGGLSASLSNLGVLANLDISVPVNTTALAGSLGSINAFVPSVTAEADWSYRSTLPGVQWAHNFESDGEITYWLWAGGYGDDPTRSQAKSEQVTRNTTDYISGGGSLQIVRPAGSTESSDWWRPFSPMEESGRGTSDQGWSSGDATIGDPVSGSSRIANWHSGNYGPASTGSWDGREFWLQLAMKLDPNRFDEGIAGGKIQYLTRTEQSLVGQEIVTYYKGTANPPGFAVYKQGGLSMTSDIAEVDHVTGWSHYLYHVIPGDENTANTTVEIWRAREGESTYTKIWETFTESIDYQDIYNKAWNALLLSTYHNGITMGSFKQQYDEVIFGETFIPAPGNTPPTTAPSWVTGAITNGWNVGEWLAISGSSPTPGYGLSATNTLLDVNTAGDNAASLNEAFIDSWTGAFLAQNHRSYGTYVMGPGGSHNNYGKGTIYLFDLETRTWEEVAGEDTSGLNSSFGEYVSGRPITNHSAFWPIYDSYRNEVLYPKGWGSPISGSDQFPVAYGHGFDLDEYDLSGYAESQWRRLPELTGISGTGGSTPTGQFKGLAAQCGGAWDGRRQRAIIVGANNSDSSSGIVASYSSLRDEWTVHAQQWSVFLGSSYAVDPWRDVLAMPVPQWGNIRCIDLKNPDTRFGSATSTSSLWTATESGAAKPSAYSQVGWEWSEAKQGFIYYSWATSSSQVKLAAYSSGGTFDSGVQTDYTLAWTNLLAGTNAVTPTSIRAAGAYNKFQLARWGDTEVAIFAPDSDGAVYAFRVS